MKSPIARAALALSSARSARREACLFDARSATSSASAFSWAPLLSRSARCASASWCSSLAMRRTHDSAEHRRGVAGDELALDIDRSAAEDDGVPTVEGVSALRRGGVPATGACLTGVPAGLAGVLAPGRKEEGEGEGEEEEGLTALESRSLSLTSSTSCRCLPSTARSSAASRAAVSTSAARSFSCVTKLRSNLSLSSAASDLAAERLCLHIDSHRTIATRAN
jgi:hypothetical protein